jgi:putative hydrolase of the HAD superfamily
MINNLARRYDAPVFEPHVTIHVGVDDVDAARQALAHSARKCTRIRLKPIGIDESEEFVKTLFVEFAITPELRQLNEMIRRAARDSSQYELKPHLSLLYKNVATATRRELAVSVTLPLFEITFDAIQAVRCVSPTQTNADVEAWRAIAVTCLSD